MRFPGPPAGEPQRAAGPGGGLAPGVTLPPWPAAAAPTSSLTPVTDAMLQHPGEQDWLTWRRAFDDSGFSPLRDITRQNVGTLRLAWSLALPAGPNEATPLVHDGVIFVHSYHDHVLALDASNGDEFWHYARVLPPGTTANVMRNIALWEDKLYLGTSDCHEVALDARTGRERLGPCDRDPKRWRISGGPLAAKGKVMQGVSGRRPGGDFIVGLDANTGEEAWRFYTVAHPGEPGDDSWNGLPLEKRSGGSVWTAGSYDPAVNLAFFGLGDRPTTPGRWSIPCTSPASPTMDCIRTATLALDPGHRVVWCGTTSTCRTISGTMTGRSSGNHRPAGQWRVEEARASRSAKSAIYDALEADTGKYAFLSTSVAECGHGDRSQDRRRSDRSRRYPDQQTRRCARTWPEPELATGSTIRRRRSSTCRGWNPAWT